MARPRLPRLLLVVFAAGTAISAPLAGQATPPPPVSSTTTPDAGFAATAQVTAIDLWAHVRDASGAVPADLTAADLEVLEDGEPRPIVGLQLPVPRVARPTSGATATPTAVDAAEAREAWQVAIYFDLPLLGNRSVKTAAENLAAQADALTALGKVELVVADPRPQRVLQATDDPALLRDALQQIARRRGGEEVTAIRREFVRQNDTPDYGTMGPLGGEKDPPRGAGGPGGAPAGRRGGLHVTMDSRSALGQGGRNVQGRTYQMREAVRESVRREAAVVARQRLLLSDWAATSGRAATRALLLVSDGWDTNPAEFYLSTFVHDSIQQELTGELRTFDSGAASEGLAQLLAADGWAVMPVALGNLRGALTTDASQGGGDRVAAFKDNKRSQSLGSTSFLLHQPLAPLQTYARESGGELVLDPAALDDGLAHLADRVRITYQVERRPDGKMHRVEVRPKRAGLTVSSQRFVAATTPDAMMAARARHLLVEGDSAGELPVALAVKRTEAAEADLATGTLEAKVDLAPLQPIRGGLTAADVRVTVALALPDGRVSVVQQVAHAQDLSRLVDWTYAAPFRAPAGTARAVVIVDELSTGIWGGRAAAF